MRDTPEPTGADWLLWLSEKDRKPSEAQQAAILKIREGLRMALRGVEDLAGLPHSFETKAEQGRR